MPGQISVILCGWGFLIFFVSHLILSIQIRKEFQLQGSTAYPSHWV